MEVKSSIIGEKVLEYLRDLDDIAYIRFASVYRHFEDVETFRRELGKLKTSGKDESHVNKPIK